MPNTPEEVELLKRCKSGSEEAFRELVTLYQRRTYWIAYNFLHDYDLAQDISQDAFLRIHQSLKRFDLEKNFYTWLYQIVINLCIDCLRRLPGDHERSYADLEQLDTRQSEAGKEPVPQQHGSETQVYEVLQKLPLKYRTLLILRDVQGMTLEDIEQVVDIPSATIRWRLHRARRLFKDLWEHKIDEVPAKDESTKIMKLEEK